MTESNALPVVQLALDFMELSRSLKCAREVVPSGITRLEAGTPLIKSEGLDALRELHAAFPELPLVADLKTMDAGRYEMEAAAKAGATHAMVLGVASDSTIKECVEAGRNYGIKVAVDLVNVQDKPKRALEVAAFGADEVHVHLPIDDQMVGKNLTEVLREVCAVVDIPVAAVGGLHSGNCVDAVAAGASILVIGGAITKATDGALATKEIVDSLRTGVSKNPELFQRATEEDIREVLMRVSTANLSDALHRGGVAEGLKPLAQGQKMVGRAVTVRTISGDWAKPVEAIDIAKEGDVIVIDSGGRPPAVWGELATESAMQRGIAGVVIDGASRDSGDIRKMSLPLFTRMSSPNAGEPKGFGEINCPVTIGNQKVQPGDWIIGDDDGVVVLKAQEAVEYANRAQDVLERENRIRAEIKAGSTLAQVVELSRWEKQ